MGILFYNTINMYLGPLRRAVSGFELGFSPNPRCVYSYFFCFRETASLTADNVRNVERPKGRGKAVPQRIAPRFPIGWRRMEVPDPPQCHSRPTTRGVGLCRWNTRPRHTPRKELGRPPPPCRLRGQPCRQMEGSARGGQRGGGASPQTGGSSCHF